MKVVALKSTCPYRCGNYIINVKIQRRAPCVLGGFPRPELLNRDARIYVDVSKERRFPLAVPRAADHCYVCTLWTLRGKMLRHPFTNCLGVYYWYRTGMHRGIPWR